VTTTGHTLSAIVIEKRKATGGLKRDERKDPDRHYLSDWNTRHFLWYDKQK
jgi:hypothetical protein